MLKCSQHSYKFDSVFNFTELLKIPTEPGVPKANLLQDLPAEEATQTEDELPEFTPRNNQDPS